MRRQEFPQFVSGFTTKVNIFTDLEFLVDARFVVLHELPLVAEKISEQSITEKESFFHFNENW